MIRTLSRSLAELQVVTPAKDKWRYFIENLHNAAKSLYSSFDYSWYVFFSDFCSRHSSACCRRYFTFVMISRRIALVLLTVYLVQYPQWSVLGMLALHVGFAILLGVARPYLYPGENALSLGCSILQVRQINFVRSLR